MILLLSLTVALSRSRHSRTEDTAFTAAISAPLDYFGIQLKQFEKWYELAVAHHQSQLIVIHGVGSGRLRDEIHDVLRLKREVKSFVNQYHPSFGYGATEIYFQY